MNDTPNQVDLNPQMALQRLDAWLDGLVRFAPNIVLALIVFAVFFFAARFVGGFVRERASAHDRENLGRVLGSFVRAVVVFVGVLTAATIVFPSIKPVDLIAGLGVSSVAIGFAFKDILQNWLAGLLILLRQPFEIGDQIEVEGYEGTVERIQTRATIIRTYDGQQVVVPNSEVYTNPVVVRTGNDLRRSQYDIGIGYGDDLPSAKALIVETLKSVDGVEQDPAPEALPWDLAASWVTIRARWWTDSRRADVVGVRAEVIEKVKAALDDAGVDMPFETQVHLFHDQTEADDGDRSSQREGWPTDDDGATVPRWRAQEQPATRGNGDARRSNEQRQ